MPMILNAHCFYSSNGCRLLFPCFFNRILMMAQLTAHTAMPWSLALIATLARWPQPWARRRLLRGLKSRLSSRCSTTTTLCQPGMHPHPLTNEYLFLSSKPSGLLKLFRSLGNLDGWIRPWCSISLTPHVPCSGIQLTFPWTKLLSTRMSSGTPLWSAKPDARLRSSLRRGESAFPHFIPTELCGIISVLQVGVAQNSVVSQVFRNS